MVKQSNVMPYGDFSIGLDKLYTYIGKPSEVFSTHSNSKIQFSMRNNVSICNLNATNYNIIFLTINLFTD